MSKRIIVFLVFSSFIISGCLNKSTYIYEEISVKEKLATYYKCLFSQIKKNDPNYKHLTSNYENYSLFLSTGATNSRYESLLPWVKKAAQKYYCY